MLGPTTIRTRAVSDAKSIGAAMAAKATRRTTGLMKKMLSPETCRTFRFGQPGHGLSAEFARRIDLIGANGRQSLIEAQPEGPTATAAPAPKFRALGRLDGLNGRSVCNLVH